MRPAAAGFRISDSRPQESFYRRQGGQEVVGDRASGEPNCECANQNSPSRANPLLCRAARSGMAGAIVDAQTGSDRGVE